MVQSMPSLLKLRFRQAQNARGGNVLDERSLSVRDLYNHYRRGIYEYYELILLLIVKSTGLLKVLTLS